MADDWIKMRPDLYRHPKVIVLTEFLFDKQGELSRFINQNLQRDMTITRNVMRNAAVGALVSVWGTARHRGKRVRDDLFIPDVTPAALDEIADLPGFGEAMLIARWLVQTKKGVVFPRFFKEHNVEPADAGPSKNALRQRALRERRRNAKHNARNNVTDNVTITPKRREREEREKSNTEYTNPLPPSLPKTLDTPEVRAALDRWTAYKAERRQSYKPTGWQQMLALAERRATEHGLPAVINALDAAMANGWTGWDHPSQFTTQKELFKHGPGNGSHTGRTIHRVK